MHSLRIWKKTSKYEICSIYLLLSFWFGFSWHEVGPGVWRDEQEGDEGSFSGCFIRLTAKRNEIIIYICFTKFDLVSGTGSRDMEKFLVCSALQRDGTVVSLLGEAHTMSNSSFAVLTQPPQADTLRASRFVLKHTCIDWVNLRVWRGRGCVWELARMARQHVCLNWASLVYDTNVILASGEPLSCTVCSFETRQSSSNETRPERVGAPTKRRASSLWIYFCF